MNLPDELRKAMPPLGDSEPRQDLWPCMLRRLDQAPRGVPWLDWVLASLLLASFFVFPQAILGFFYQM
ncbi:MAG: hypothetical protein LAP85_16220 [Acidobacteriia bacterium]|nr:hypothetical protein [Terriglobia bacterium]